MPTQALQRSWHVFLPLKGRWEQRLLSLRLSGEDDRPALPGNTPSYLRRCEATAITLTLQIQAWSGPGWRGESEPGPLGEESPCSEGPLLGQLRQPRTETKADSPPHQMLSSPAREGSGPQEVAALVVCDNEA